MTKLERMVRPDGNLLYTLILSIFTSVIFLLFMTIIFYIGSEVDLSEPIVYIPLMLLIISHLTTAVMAYIFYFNTQFMNSEDLAERARFTYLWCIFLGFVFLVPLIILRSYLLSGGKMEIIKGVQREHETNVIKELVNSGQLKSMIKATGDKELLDKFTHAKNL